MCGINGIYAYHYAANPIDRRELATTRDHMAARGPDGKGEWVGADERVALGHRRLAIIDLSEAGAQPMHSGDGRFVVTFNGEIYNYPDLRRQLEARGRVIRSTCDTEILLHLYAEKGEAMVHDLRGMFAFAIWDCERRRLFLARDPYGIKPLYYADDGWTFRFASQVKALLAGGGISREPEPAGIVGFYLLGSVPEPFTTKASVRALPAGSTMTVDRLGAHEPRTYHSIAAVYSEAEARAREDQQDEVETRDSLRKAIRDSVACHLFSDVPVGAFLSAGVDSGALVGLMRDAGARTLRTTTVAFQEFRGTANDEAPIAAQVATLYGTDHETRIVTKAEFEADLPRIVAAMDQPSIDGINSWFVAKAARARGLKVAISGLGGDELLGGYPSFRDIPRWVAMLRAPGAVPLLGSAVRRLAQPLVRALGANPKLAGLFELGGTWEGAYLLKRGLFMPWELGEVLDRDLIKEGFRRLQSHALIRQAINPIPQGGFARVASLEASLYMRNQLLRDADWASMAHSLELRVPLVDHVLLRHAAAAASMLARGAGKTVLAGAPARPLPLSIVGRRKTGFSTPVRDWMRSASQMDALLPRQRGGQSASSRDWARTVHSEAAAWA